MSSDTPTGSGPSGTLHVDPSASLAPPSGLSVSVASPNSGTPGRSPRPIPVFSGKAADEDLEAWSRQMTLMNKKSAQKTAERSGKPLINKSPNQLSAAAALNAFAALTPTNSGANRHASMPMSSGPLPVPRENLSRAASAAPAKAGGVDPMVRKMSLSSVTDWKPFNPNQQTQVIHEGMGMPSRQGSVKGLPTVAEKGQPGHITRTGSGGKSIYDLPPSPTYTAGQFGGNSWEDRFNRFQRSVLIETELTQRLQTFMSSNVYLIVNVFLTVFTLFAHDFTIAFVPKAADRPIDALLTIVFVWFSIELIVNCLTRRGYFLSFYFFLDLVGTFSLIFDISFMSDSFIDRTSSTTDREKENLSRSTSALRITKFARILRVMRLVRVVKLFRFTGSLGKSLKERDQNANKVGLSLSELIDRRVIIAILGLLIVLPFLSSDVSEADNSAEMGLLMLDSLNPNVTASFNAGARSGDIIFGTNFNYSSSEEASVVSLYSSYVDNCIYLKVGSRVYLNRLNEYDYLRDTEIETYSSSISSSVAVINIRNSHYQDSAFAMLVTIFIILLFAFGSFMISKDVYHLVVAPLNRMSNIIKKLAGTICFLSSSNENQSEGSSAAGEENNQYETVVIEEIISKLAAIFNVEPDTSGTLDKGLSRLGGSKKTQIRTANSIVSIDVVERPRERTVELKDVIEMSVDDPNSYIEPNVDLYPELANIQSILTNANVMSHFKLYMTSNLLIENLLFYQEVQRYKTIFLAHTMRLYDNFVSPTAETQVNIPSSQLEAIRHNIRRPRSSIFDDAQYECMLLLRAHYRPFVESKYCQVYLRTKTKIFPRGFGGASIAQLDKAVADRQRERMERQKSVHRSSHNRASVSEISKPDRNSSFSSVANSAPGPVITIAPPENKKQTPQLHSEHTTASAVHEMSSIAEGLSPTNSASPTNQSQAHTPNSDQEKKAQGLNETQSNQNQEVETPTEVPASAPVPPSAAEPEKADEQKSELAPQPEIKDDAANQKDIAADPAQVPSKVDEKSVESPDDKASTDALTAPVVEPVPTPSPTQDLDAEVLSLMFPGKSNAERRRSSVGTPLSVSADKGQPLAGQTPSVNTPLTKSPPPEPELASGSNSSRLLPASIRPSQNMSKSAALTAAEIDELTRRLENPGGDALDLMFVGDKQGRKQAQMKVVSSAAKLEPGELVVKPQNQSATAAPQRTRTETSRSQSGVIADHSPLGQASPRHHQRQLSTKGPASLSGMSQEELEREVASLVNPGAKPAPAANPSVNSAGQPVTVTITEEAQDAANLAYASDIQALMNPGNKAKPNKPSNMAKSM